MQVDNKVDLELSYFIISFFENTDSQVKSADFGL